MGLIDLIRIVRKHIVLLVITPIFMAALVFLLTTNSSRKYESEMTLYTGIASGSSVEMDKSYNYYTASIAFDNLMTIIKLRKTQEEVAIRLLTQHLMLSEHNPKYLSHSSFEELKKITPAYIRELVKTTSDPASPKSQDRIEEKKGNIEAPDAKGPQFLTHKVSKDETLFSIAGQYGLSVEQIKEINNLSGNKIRIGQKLKIDKLPVIPTVSEAIETNKPFGTEIFTLASTHNSPDNSKLFLPPKVDFQSFEEKVHLLSDLYNSSDTNFVYKLLNFIHPHYSLDAVSSINVQRINNSDLVKLKYESDDPGICQHTLYFFNEVFMRSYKKFKENNSDAVVAYFELQLKLAEEKVESGEGKLLMFNKEYNIINYEEQSKSVASLKEQLDVEYHNKRSLLAGSYAAIKRLEEKLDNQQLVQLNNSRIIDLRNRLSEINIKISTLETTGGSTGSDVQKLADLKIQADHMKEEIKQAIGELYTHTNSVNGLPVSKILTDWLNNVVEAESTRAEMEVLGERIKNFQKEYAIYAPAGANLKKIEREISISEKEFLEILHSLNLAKLKMQDNELSSDITIVDQPFFPLNPIPTKRKFLILAAAMLGFMIVLSTVFAMEFFDNTLKNPSKATKLLKLPFLAIFPKILLNTQNVNFPYIASRMLEIATQNIRLHLRGLDLGKSTKTLLFISTLNDEGKSVVAGNIALKFKSQGERILYMDFSRESLTQAEGSPFLAQGGTEEFTSSSAVNSIGRFSILNWLLGYPDARIDHRSHFLKNPENYLSTEEFYRYQIDEKFYSASNYMDIIDRKNYAVTDVPDFVLIVLPPILYHAYPAGLVADADLSVLICRSNRIWSAADQGVLDVILKIANQKTFFVLNGVELSVVETVLGELPKKKS